MTLLREFILRNEDHARALLAFIKANAKAMAGQGKPLNVRVSEHKAKRTNEQNALMWALLTTISEQAYVGGQRFAPETWNEQMKREHLPEETARGLKKWAYLPSGERVLSISTTDLDTGEMSDYIDRLQASAVMELGVMFEDAQ